MGLGRNGGCEGWIGVVSFCGIEKVDLVGGIARGDAVMESYLVEWNRVDFLGIFNGDVEMFSFNLLSVGAGISYFEDL